MTEDERRETQARFLLLFRDSANVRQSCEAAGIDRKTLAAWRRRKDFEARYQEALLDAADTLRTEAWRRGRDGVLEPVVSGGQIIYEQVPMLEADGVTVVTDKYGRPKYTRGPMLTVRKYDSSLLQKLMAAHLPECKPTPASMKAELETNADGTTKVRAVFVMPEVDPVGE
jgi:hypothetical protein